ncbi:MAG: alkaline phosphatase family protein [Myxococcota bacterium]
MAVERANGVRWILAAVLASSVGILCAAGCRPTLDLEPRREGRVLLLGIDGATLRVVTPMIAEGRLPHLASLSAQGVSGPLRSFPPFLSPRIWATIATGKVPEKHGIERWSRGSGGEGPRLYYSFDRRTPALWNIASAAGLKVGVVNWLNTYPPERIEGVMVTDHAFPDDVESQRWIGELLAGRELTEADEGEGGPVVFPPEWTPRLMAASRSGAPLTRFSDPFEANDELPHWLFTHKLSEFFVRDRELVKIALEIEQGVHPGILMVLLQGIDRVSHSLWGTLEPADLYPEKLRPSARERRGGAAALETYYEYTDALLGVLLSRYGPDDLVMVVSDHGFEAGVAWHILTGVHKSEQARDGLIFARGPGVPVGQKATGMTVNDVTPTLLAWLGLPVADDMDGRVAAFLEAPATDRVASYDGLPIERVTRLPSGLEEDIVRQLRELGYVQ